MRFPSRSSSEVRRNLDTRRPDRLLRRSPAATDLAEKGLDIGVVPALLLAEIPFVMGHLLLTSHDSDRLV